MYKKREHLHFMGIGGIGMSGIAEIVRLEGYTVSGCDANLNNKTITHLQELGCTIHQGHHADHMHDTDVLIYSSAVDQHNPEIKAALAKGIPVIPRALMLAELMRTRFSVAVAGSHGKTTTTSLISHILLEAHKRPTVIIGGILKSIDSNAHLGESNLLIAEADESDRSFLHLNPTMSIVTNIDAEHLDTYKDLEDIKQTFKDFLGRLPFYGKAFVCIDDPAVAGILPLPHIHVVTYGLDGQADIVAREVNIEGSSSSFTVYSYLTPAGHKTTEPRLLGSVTLSIPGKHNVSNALAAIALCLEFDVPFNTIAHALSTFKGVERRFEFKGIYQGAEVFDDYGHHPTEILHTLRVARRRVKQRLFIAFQPHRYSRTYKLWNEFVQLFADQYDLAGLFITDIAPASELPLAGVTTKNLIKAIQEKNAMLPIYYAASYAEVVEQVKTRLQSGDLFLTLGAGKIYQAGEMLLDKAL